MKKFTLAVSKPCHQDWEAMAPEEKGRFCAACQKTVVDFTNMSDREISTTCLSDHFSCRWINQSQIVIVVFVTNC